MQIGKIMVGAILFVLVVMGASLFFVGVGNNYNMNSNDVGDLEDLQTLETRVYGNITSHVTGGAGSIQENDPEGQWGFESVELVTGAFVALKSLFEIPSIMATIISMIAELLHIPAFLPLGVGLILTILIAYEIMSALLKWRLGG